MPRPPRVVVPGIPHHVTQRGNHRQPVFFAEQDHQLYMDLLTLCSRRYDVQVLAWCLMPNHVHLILVPERAESLSRMLQRMHSEYARIVHLRTERSGHLWEQRFYSVAMDEEHLWCGMIYVEQNPVRAGLAEEPWAWPWSSARVHALGAEAGLADLSFWGGVHTPESWRLMLQHGVADGAMLQRIREATTKQLPVGSAEFLRRIEQDYGVRTRHSKPGRKPRNGAPEPAKSGIEVSDTDRGTEAGIGVKSGIEVSDTDSGYGRAATSRSISAGLT